MRVVTLEEHFTVPSLVRRISPEAIARRGFAARKLVPGRVNPLDLLPELGEQRLKSMDDNGISVQVLSTSGPGAAKLVANCFAYLVSLAFCLIILVATTQQALRGLSDDTTLSALPLPVGPAYSFVPLGFLALTVAMLADLTRIRSGRSYLFREETPSA